MSYNEELKKAKTRNCEKCGANYTIGKFYGDKWCELPNPEVETKGLCEFCRDKFKNPKK